MIVNILSLYLRVNVSKVIRNATSQFGNGAACTNLAIRITQAGFSRRYKVVLAFISEATRFAIFTQNLSLARAYLLRRDSCGLISSIKVELFPASIVALPFPLAVTSSGTIAVTNAHNLKPPNKEYCRRRHTEVLMNHSNHVT